VNFVRAGDADLVRSIQRTTGKGMMLDDSFSRNRSFRKTIRKQSPHS
jgi:hypothetical protein